MAMIMIGSENTSMHVKYIVIIEEYIGITDIKGRKETKFL